jgi:hypothetical protein
MMLTDVPNNTKIKVGDLELDFKHVDGMYSLCYNGTEPVHLACWTDVEIVEVDNDIELVD